MLVDNLARIPEFAHVPPSELRALAARAHVLCVPGDRCLIQAGKVLNAYFYLLKGRLAICPPRRRLQACSFGQLRHFYPGCASARTLGAVQILRIDKARHEFLCAAHPGSLEVRALASEQWLSRFLGSHMMRRLDSHDWQVLLAAFKADELEAGAAIVRRGDAARQCFVIESGHAVVHDGARTLAHLGPGDFFGEDALVLGSVRNAHVTALEAVRIQAIDQHLFASVVLDRLIQYVACCGAGCTMELGKQVTLENVRGLAAQLDVRNRYYVIGGNRRQRALCALLLIQRGIQAYAVDGT